MEIKYMNKFKKILIFGLPGSGKTTLATELKKHLNAVHFNADEVRQNINKDLGFSLEDRNEQARRMGWLCDRVTETGQYVIADFVCPTESTRKSFGSDNALVIWIDRIIKSRYSDTNSIFESPLKYDIKLQDGTPKEWVSTILEYINLTKPSGFLLGRYQPFHDGHKTLAVETINRVGYVTIAVRNTVGMDSKNPFNFFDIKQGIDEKMKEYDGMYEVILLPNITNIFYGRDVGYKIEKLEVSRDIENISATKIRESMNISKIEYCI